jgi:hypothetical protein
LAKVRSKKSAEQMKRVIFTKPLLEKILAGAAQVTYRKTRMNGYYYISTNRFKPRAKDAPVIFVYQTEEIEPENLTDEDANLAGVDSISEMHRLFKKWYGDPLPRLHRNWFRLVKSFK